jgi:hypothetical protein
MEVLQVNVPRGPHRAQARKRWYNRHKYALTPICNLSISISLLIGLRLSVQKVMVVQQSILPNDRWTKLWISL